MGYLDEFKALVEEHKLAKLLSLWEEYCANDRVDADEFIAILKFFKQTDYAKELGQYMEAALPLWQYVTDEKKFFEVLRLVVDLQTSNSSVFADAAYQLLEKHYGNQPEFSERIRLIGLRSRDHFEGAISKYVLLDHMKKGKFVFHTAGWGTGEILEISPLREQLTVEFENVPALRHLTFTNALKTLIPLSDDHFLAKRFGNPDALEKEGREDPVGLIQSLLRDLGPKTAAEIKEEVCELVIPEEDWSRWWQAARSKLKKHPFIKAPESQKDSFYLREEGLTHEERIEAAIHEKQDLNQKLQSLYQLVRDHPHMIKEKELKDSITEQANQILESDEVTEEILLQTWLFLKHLVGDHEAGEKAERFVSDSEDLINVIQRMEIIALKKRAMILIHSLRTDWIQLFLQLLSLVPQVQLRDYLFQELNHSEASKVRLLESLQHLLHTPRSNPELFIWYFQKILPQGKEIPFSHKEGICMFFEAFLILYNEVEMSEIFKDLAKKMYLMLINKRYALVREIIEGTSIEYLREFLLLISKCHTFTENDKSIMRSLAEVVHPELADKKVMDIRERFGSVIWTTEEGYRKVQERIRDIGTKEMIETAREIEKARSYGDLRENSEYKYALEKRSRLQSELKMLSEQLNHARIITPQDVDPEEVGIGSIVELIDSSGKKITYTILGPWDANPDINILSFQSKLAQAMVGCKVGDHFEFKSEEYKVADIGNMFST